MLLAVQYQVMAPLGKFGGKSFSLLDMYITSSNYITDTRYYGQNSDPIYRGLTKNDSQYYRLSLFQTQNDVPKVSTITRVDCITLFSGSPNFQYAPYM